MLPPVLEPGTPGTRGFGTGNPHIVLGEEVICAAKVGVRGSTRERNWAEEEGMISHYTVDFGSPGPLNTGHQPGCRLGLEISVVRR